MSQSETWAELVIDSPEELADIIGAYVALLGGGVEVRDADTLLRAPAPGRVALVAYVRPEKSEEWVAALGGRFAGIAISVRLRDETEWRDVWKQYFKPRRVAERFVVVPSWESFAASPADLRIDLDPGRAFGTGSHESTQLVMTAIEKVPPARSFLDVGTGSGILAIAAALLWPAARGLAVDVDPEAVACAEENLVRNGLLGRVEVSGQAVDDVEGSFDAVFANVTAEVLLALISPIAERVGAGGWLVLSGMLRESADAVAARYAGFGLAVEQMLDQGEWRAAVLRKAG
jgi:ribosomal protein L11 methyltransferase